MTASIAPYPGEYLQLYDLNVLDRIFKEHATPGSATSTTDAGGVPKFTYRDDDALGFLAKVWVRDLEPTEPKTSPLGPSKKACTHLWMDPSVPTLTSDGAVFRPYSLHMWNGVVFGPALYPGALADLQVGLDLSLDFVIDLVVEASLQALKSYLNDANEREYGAGVNFGLSPREAYGLDPENLELQAHPSMPATGKKWPLFGRFGLTDPIDEFERYDPTSPTDFVFRFANEVMARVRKTLEVGTPPLASQLPNPKCFRGCVMSYNLYDAAPHFSLDPNLAITVATRSPAAEPEDMKNLASWDLLKAFAVLQGGDGMPGLEFDEFLGAEADANHLGEESELSGVVARVDDSAEAVRAYYGSLRDLGYGAVGTSVSAGWTSSPSAHAARVRIGSE